MTSSDAPLATNSVHGTSAFLAGGALTASVCGVKAVGDLFKSASTPGGPGAVRMLALSQFTTSALSLATLVRPGGSWARGARALRQPAHAVCGQDDEAQRERRDCAVQHCDRGDRAG